MVHNSYNYITLRINKLKPLKPVALNLGTLERQYCGTLDEPRNILHQLCQVQRARHHRIDDTNCVVVWYLMWYYWRSRRSCWAASVHPLLKPKLLIRIFETVARWNGRNQNLKRIDKQHKTNGLALKNIYIMQPSLLMGHDDVFSENSTTHVLSQTKLRGGRGYRSSSSGS